jgi:hypothetical protein
MLKQRNDDDISIPLQKFAEFNKKLFYDEAIGED